MTDENNQTDSIETEEQQVEEVVEEITEQPVEVKTEVKQGFFAKLKSFFKKEEQKPVEQGATEPAPVQREIRFEECFWCQKPVYLDEKWSKQQNREFHRPCYKKFLQAGHRGKI